MRRKIVSEEIIVEAAEQIIREEGLAKCSMRRLSKELGIAVGTIFNYYETREKLLEAVFMTSWQRTVERAEAYIDTQTDLMMCLSGITGILQEDMRNRNGLGGLLKSTDSSFWIRGRSYLDKALYGVFLKALEVIGHVEESEKLAKWVSTIVFMCLIEYKGVSDEDWQRIELFLN